MAAVLVPDTNEHEAAPAIVPSRYSSTSAPAEVSIVSPELNSVSSPRIWEEEPPTLAED